MRKKPKQNSNECSQSASSISHPRPGYLLTRSKRSKTSYLFLARRLIRLFHRRTYVSFQTCVCICVCVFVWVAQLCPTLCDPMNCSPPGSFVHGILQAIYWSGLLFSSLGDLPKPGIKPRFPALQADSLLSELPRKPSGIWVTLIQPLQGLWIVANSQSTEAFRNLKSPLPIWWFGKFWMRTGSFLTIDQSCKLTAHLVLKVGQ